MDSRDDLEQLMRLGDKIEVSMGVCKYQTQAEDLKDSLDLLFAAIQLNLNDIKALREIVKC